jgi:type I restriction enzyme S subunit
LYGFYSVCLLGAITPKDGYCEEFIYYYLRYVRSDLERTAPQSAQKNINLKTLAPLPIPDVPIDEQRRMVSYLDNIDKSISRLERLQAQTSAELDAMLPSILDKAFKGEL